MVDESGVGVGVGGGVVVGGVGGGGWGRDEFLGRKYTDIEFLL